MSFAKMDFEVLTDSRLSAGAKLFLAHLQRWDWGGGCWLTDRQLAREIGCTERTVRNHTHALEEAGYLWVFEDREGLPVRLVVRAGHVYPRPRGLGKPLPKSGKIFSKPFKVYIEADEFEAEETTCAEIPDPVPPEPVQEAAVVEEEPTDQNGTPEGPDADQIPEANPQPEALPDAALTAVAVLQDAGVSRPAALRMARAHPVRRIEAAARYARQYRGEKLNAPGLIVSALHDGWKLPGWAYRSKGAQDHAERTGSAQDRAERTGSAQDQRSTTGPTTGPQELDAAYWARYRAETWGFVDPLDVRTWQEIRADLGEAERAYCEHTGA